jgi:hypothetical protein
VGGVDELLDLGVGQVLALARSSRFGGRRGGRIPATVPFSVGGGTSRRFDFAMSHVLPVRVTVP